MASAAAAAESTAEETTMARGGARGGGKVLHSGKCATLGGQGTSERKKASNYGPLIFGEESVQTSSRGTSLTGATDRLKNVEIIRLANGEITLRSFKLPASLDSTNLRNSIRTRFEPIMDRVRVRGTRPRPPLGRGKTARIQWSDESRPWCSLTLPPLWLGTHFRKKCEMYEDN